MFVFHKDFRVQQCNGGGLVLEQYDGAKWNSWAFSTLEDFVAFLIEQKRKQFPDAMWRPLGSKGEAGT